MRNLSLIMTLGQLLISIASMAQIKVNSNGFVGINNSNPQYRIDVSGNFRVADGTNSLVFNTALYPTGNVNLGQDNQRWNYFYTTFGFFTYSPIIASDINLKTDISNITNVREKLLLLRPVSYKLNPQKLNISDEGSARSPKMEIGLIAQELKEVFPDMVTESESGTLGIRYTELIPILIQAFKEQQEEIAALKKRIEALEATKNQ